MNGSVGGGSTSGSTSIGGNNGGTAGKPPKADESVFRGASIKKTWLDKKNEAKIKKEREDRAHEAANTFIGHAAASIIAPPCGGPPGRR